MNEVSYPFNVGDVIDSYDSEYICYWLIVLLDLHRNVSWHVPYDISHIREWVSLTMYLTHDIGTSYLYILLMLLMSYEVIGSMTLTFDGFVLRFHNWSWLKIISVQVWTNRDMHIENTTVNMVESDHNRSKKY